MIRTAEQQAHEYYLEQRQRDRAEARGEVFVPEPKKTASELATEVDQYTVAAFHAKMQRKVAVAQTTSLVPTPQAAAAAPSTTLLSGTIEEAGPSSNAGIALIKEGPGEAEAVAAESSTLQFSRMKRFHLTMNRFTTGIDKPAHTPLITAPTLRMT